MVVDIASRRIIQVSEGITRHWPGLQTASALIASPLADWVAGVEADDPLTIETLHASGPMVLPWRPRFERTNPMQAQPAASGWECLAHRSADMALLEWLPMISSADELRRQSQIFTDFGAVIVKQRARCSLMARGGIEPPTQGFSSIVSMRRTWWAYGQQACGASPLRSNLGGRRQAKGWDECLSVPAGAHTKPFGARVCEA